MSRVLTSLIIALIAGAAVWAICAMFRPEQPAPVTSAQTPDAGRGNEAPAVEPLSRPEVLATAQASGREAGAVSKTQQAVAGASQTSSTRASRPLQQLAGLSANDRAMRDRATQALIEQAAADPEVKPKLLEELHAAFDSANSNGKLRILYVAANLRGNTRVNVDDPRAPAAMLAGIHYLEAHLNDPEISNFGPQESFTHLALSKGENGWVWLLDDIANGRGINLYFDPTGTKIIRATTWPK